MPAILQQGAVIQCPHGGTVTAVPTNAVVRVNGAFALLVSDLFLVAGCSFVIGTTPSPCVTVEWQLPATKIAINGTAVLLDSSLGLCKGPTQAVQGTALISGVQTKVDGM
ncbi:MAG TPA: hypothetical protein VFH83_01975 [Spirochaetia bacterium]|nr:hypothetical protein [Spirochaetia bacterium]